MLYACFTRVRPIFARESAGLRLGLLKRTLQAAGAKPSIRPDGRVRV